MKIIDISWTISERMTVYKDKRVKRPRITQTKTLRVDGANESKYVLESHTGTHVDSPRHFIRRGRSINNISLSSLVGLCKVLDLTRVRDKITVEELKKHSINNAEIVLLKTKNSSLPETAKFAKEFVYLDKGGAVFLASKGVKAVGIDYLGIERNQPLHESHKTLLRKNVAIIEGLRLKHVQPGHYTLICLPLKIDGGDAAPARAILLKE